MRLVLLPPAPKGQGEQRLTWKVGPGRAELSATARWTGLPVAGLLQWEIPAGIHLGEVRGPNLRSWSRTGSHLQAWLDSTDALGADQEIILQISGWLPRPAAEADQEKTPFVLPNLLLPGLADQTSVVQVAARDGWRLAPQEIHGLVPAPDADLPGYRWTGYGSAANSRAVFRLLPASGTADAQVLTSVEANNRQLQLQSWLDVAVPPAQNGLVPNSIALEVRRATGWNPQVELPPGCRLRETASESGATYWTIDMAPGRHLLRVFGRRSLNNADDVSVPSVSIRSLHARPATVRSWIAVSGPELQTISGTGLQPEAPGPNEMPETLRLRGKSAARVWKVTQDDWRLRIQPVGGESLKPLVVARAQAAVGADGAWLQEVQYWLYQQAEAEWSITLPPAAQLLSEYFDGQERVSSSLPGRFPSKPGLHFLRLVWKTGSSLPDPKPRFEMPRLELAGQIVSTGPVRWTIRVPDGDQLNSTYGAERISLAASNLHQAAAEIQILRSISQQTSTESIEKLQRDVGRNLALAEQRLTQSSATISGETGPNGQPLAVWSQQLRGQFPAQAFAGKHPDEPLPYTAVFDQGEAYCWLGVPEKAGEVRTVPPSAGLLGRSIATAALGLLLLLGLWSQKSGGK
jgi:hypothetical protein